VSSKVWEVHISEIIHLGSSQKVVCPQLSKEFGIDDFDLSLPDISTLAKP